MEKFIPSAEQLAIAKKVADKNKVKSIYMNKNGELFLQENLAQLSVKDKNDYTVINFTVDGATQVPEFIEYEIKEEDLERNPFMRNHYNVGDKVQLPKPVKVNTPDPAVVEEEKEEGTGTSDKKTEGEAQDVNPAATADTNSETGSQIQPPAPLPFDITNLSTKQVEAELAKIADKVVLQKLLEAEQAAGNRKGVCALLEERINAIG